MNDEEREKLANDAVYCGLLDEMSNVAGRVVARMEIVAGLKVSRDEAISTIVAAVKKVEADEAHEKRTQVVRDLAAERVARGLAPPPPAEAGDLLAVNFSFDHGMLDRVHRVAAALHGEVSDASRQRVVVASFDRGLMALEREVAAKDG